MRWNLKKAGGKPSVRRTETAYKAYVGRMSLLNKRVRARQENLAKLGIDKNQAWQWANSRLGYWRIAGSWIPNRSLTNEYLASQGYDDISGRYEAMRLSYRTAVYRTVRTVV